MQTKQQLVLLAERDAGHHAYETIRRHDVETGGEILAALFSSYLRAFAAVHGWDETLHRVNAQARKHRAVSNQPICAPHLVVSNTAEIVGNPHSGAVA